MVTHRDFLKKTLPHFRNSRMGFVQTPQYYHNTKGNAVAETAWKQQELFFGPIMRGKEKAVPFSFAERMSSSGGQHLRKRAACTKKHRGGFPHFNHHP
jgi:cellulose synthase/poly-beta-1,6-N-acetylglucosamine synthase-like glycosyltransferase